MSDINLLIEKYFDTWVDSGRGTQVEIWENPSRQEWRKELNNYRYIRFLVDTRKGKVYCADANNILHEWMWYFIKINTKGFMRAILDGDVIGGYFDENGKLILERVAEDMSRLPDLKWVDKYLPTFSNELNKLY